MFFFFFREPTKRDYKIPKRNFNAAHRSLLIDLSRNGFTEEFSDFGLRESSKSVTKLELPDLPSDSQSGERALKLTTPASQSAYGIQARHRQIITNVLCHEMRCFFASNGSYVKQFNMMA